MDREAQHYIACAYGAGLLRHHKPEAEGAIHTLTLTKARHRREQREILRALSARLHQPAYA